MSARTVDATPAPPARERLIAAAVDAFAEKGFNGTTTRDIAARAGMSPAAVYVHHASKESLLFTVSLQGHREALAVVEHAAQSAADPVGRVRGIVRDFTRWHTENGRVARIVQYELHVLTPEHRAELAVLRHAIERHVQDALVEGVDQGVLDVPDVPGTTLALLSLGIDPVRWFVPGGSRSAAQIAELNADLAERMLRPANRVAQGVRPGARTPR